MAAFTKFLVPCAREGASNRASELPCNSRFQLRMEHITEDMHARAVHALLQQPPGLIKALVEAHPVRLGTKAAEDVLPALLATLPCCLDLQACRSCVHAGDGGGAALRVSLSPPSSCDLDMWALRVSIVLPRLTELSEVHLVRQPLRQQGVAHTLTPCQVSSLRSTACARLPQQTHEQFCAGLDAALHVGSHALTRALHVGSHARARQKTETR